MMAPSSNGGKNVLGDDVYVGFEELIQGCDVAVKAMVCRKWDVHNSFGKYLSTEFILSDSQCESMGVVQDKLEEMEIKYKRAQVNEGGINVDQLFFHDPDGFMI